MLVLHDPDTLLHSTVELLGARLIPALESPDRVKAILTSLYGSLHKLRIINTDSSLISSLSDIARKTHDPSYLDHISTVFQSWVSAGLIQESESVLPECFRYSTSAHPVPVTPPKDIYARAGFFAFDMSTGIMKDTYLSTIASANLAYQATKTLFPLDTSSSARPNTITALTRPPGHHCDGHRAGGYCYVNNAAIAISTFRDLSPSTNPPPKTAVLDLDFHHGNGTQEIFYSDPTVLYASIHGEDEFPYYTGSASERGAGTGEGFNLNIPLPTNSSLETYLSALDTALEAVEKYNPEFLVVSLGFDTFHLDPLGKFGIETTDYEIIAKRTRSVLIRKGTSKEVLPAVILLEGGYVIDRLGINLISFLKGWEDAESGVH